MYCPRCRTQLPERPRFCPVCGAMLDISHQSTVPPSGMEQPPAQSNAPPLQHPISYSALNVYNSPPPAQHETKNGNIWPWLLMGLVTVVVVVVLIFVLLGGDNRNGVDIGDAGKSVQISMTPTPPLSVNPVEIAQVEPIVSQKETWAIYWYICGSDLESDGGFASDDIDEMMRVKLPENITVVIETGGAQKWRRKDIDAKRNCRFVYDSDGFRIVEKNRSANMGESDTLADFLQFCNDNYPADKRAVIFWNHGGGSVAGLMFDELYGYDSLTLTEMRDAFEATQPPSAENPPYELIGFDACLMATIDMVEALNGYARWMVASQEVEPSTGWSYLGILEALASDSAIDGRQLGVVVCDSYYADCVEYEVATDVTLSVIDMSYADELLAAFYDIGAESLFYACDNTSFFGEFGRAARSAISFGGNNVWNGYANMVDIGDLVLYSYNLLPEFGQVLLNTLNECVVYSVNGKYRDRASGLSCYYSYNGDYDEFENYVLMNSDTPFRWFYEYKITGTLSDEGMQYVEDLMQRYSRTQEISTRDISSPIDLDDYPIALRDDGSAVLDLGIETASQLTGVYCYVAYYDMDNDLILILGRTDDIYSDWENGVFSDNFSGYWVSIDDCLVYMELIDTADDYKLYTVPILLNGEEYSLSISYTIATGKYDILGAWRGIDDNGMADKDLRQLQEGDTIEPLLFYLFDMDDPDEEPTIMSVDSFSLTENTSLEEIFMGDGYYILIYEMVDILNNSYLSDSVTYQIIDGVVHLLKL